MMKDGLQVGQCGLGANKTEKLFRENRKRHAAQEELRTELSESEPADHFQRRLQEILSLFRSKNRKNEVKRAKRE
jgi:hypothetical protein